MPGSLVREYDVAISKEIYPSNKDGMSDSIRVPADSPEDLIPKTIA